MDGGRLGSPYSKQNRHELRVREALRTLAQQLLARAFHGGPFPNPTEFASSSHRYFLRQKNVGSHSFVPGL
jgi:hypothetical protein